MQVAPELIQARIAVTFYFAFSGFVTGSWVSRIPAIAERLELSAAVLGTVLVGNMIGALVGGFAGEGVWGRWGSKRTTRFAAVAIGCWLPLVALMPSPIGLFVGLLVYGLFYSTLNITMNAQAFALEARYARPISSMFHSIWSLGALLGSLAGSSLAGLAFKPWLHFLLVGAVGALLAWGFGPRLLESPTLPGRRVLALPRGPLLWIGLMALCVAISDGTASSWSGVYLRSLNAPESVAALGFVTHQGIMMLGRLSGDWLVARFGPVGLIRFGALLGGTGLALGVLSTTLWGALIGIGCMGWGMATTYPLMFAAAARLSPASTATAIASVASMSTVGGLIGPILMGNVAELAGLKASLLLAAGLAGVVSWLAFSLGQRKERR
jgi:MFS family permease